MPLPALNPAASVGASARRATPPAAWLCAALLLVWAASSARAQAPAAGAGAGAAGGAGPVAGTVYRCPGNPVLYTDQISAREAQERGCRTIDGAPITIVQSPRPRAAAPAAAPVPGAPVAASPAGSRIDPAEQRARDTDARRILEAELRKEEERLAALQKEFNNGEPERRGDERNYQKYLDRVAELKSSIARKESDIAAIKRELAKLPAAGG